MSRWLPILTLVAVLVWLITLIALVCGYPILTIRIRGDEAAVVTVGVHLAVAGWLRFTRRQPTRVVDPVWANVQAEKHRRKGACFAGWGTAAGCCWLLVRPEVGPMGATVGWPVWFVVAANLGFQPGLIGAEILAIHARIRLGRLVRETQQVGLIASPGF